MTWALRALRTADIPALAELNDSAVPAVNALGVEGLTAHLASCDLTIVVARAADDVPLGLVLAIAPGSGYTSENYLWFSTHRPGSLYVDRIVVAPHAHGVGVGRALYRQVDARAAALGLGEITCEVNLDPPNPGSLAFHHRLGFTCVGEQVTKDGSVRVALLARSLAHS